MLQQVLDEIKSAGGTINLNELAGKLNIEPGALEGMVQFWIRKGRLKETDVTRGPAGQACNTASCACSCPGPQGCPFVMTPPRTLSITITD
jgi:hypothetical protein